MVAHSPAPPTNSEIVPVGARTLEIRDETLFRIGGVLRLNDGSLVVANRGSQSLHFYSSDGTPVGTAGGQGDGPGEFGSLLNIFPVGPDIFGAYDARNRRVSTFTADGQHVRTVPLRVEGGIQDVRGFDDGSLSVLMGARRPAQFADRDFYQDTLPHLRVSSDGEPLDTIGRHLGQTQHVFTFEIDGQVTRFPTAFHYSPRAIVATSGDTYLIGDGADYEIRRHSRNGQLVAIARRGDRTTRVPVSGNLRDELIERRREAYAAAAQRFAVWQMVSDGLGEVPTAELLPAFGTGRHSILVDEAGGFWVAHFMVGDEPERFDIFSSNGVFRATAEMPAGFRASLVTSREVVGVMTSELDEEWIEAYSIRLPS